MQVLIVHDDAEVGEQLAAMVQDYSEHQCDLARDDVAALAWARGHARCGLLITQLEGTGIDGFTLGGSLSEIFPGLQTLFLPAYPAAEQRLEIATTKIFPEPIDGDRLLKAIDAAARVEPHGPDLFHVMDVLQMCCLSERSGAVQVVREPRSGILFLRNGKIIHAEDGAHKGMDALLEIATWNAVEFAYDHSVRGEETISLPWDEALSQAVIRQKEEREREASKPKLERSAEAEEPPPRKKRGIFGALRR